MSNFSFFEYSYNPIEESATILEQRLMQLGFYKRSDHKRSNVALWTQGVCILLLRPNSKLEGHSRITGVGIISNSETIAEQHFAVPCHETDFLVIDMKPFRFYLIEEHSLDWIIENNYDQVSSHANMNTVGFEHFSGVEIDTDNPRIAKTFLDLGFTKDGTDTSIRLISPNKRFTVIIRHKSNKGSHTAIIDTHDVFKATANLILNDVKLMDFNDDPDDFKELTHKIKGYDCIAFGKYNSYSIENYIPKEVLNFNIIFRQRKQYIKVSEVSLDYYATKKQSDLIA